MRALLGLAVAVALLGAVATGARGQVPEPARPQAASLDSEAPPGAPPHWLPDEEWVMQHWLPYDERRLYALLGVTRGDTWRWLRDDTRSLADLARRRGKDPRRLARALVAPWRGRLRDPSRLALLERRALRTLTQGHLAQHLFFHSLHQDAIPDNAPEIFGVRSRAEFAALRRSELSPLQICRLNGLPRSHAERRAEATLRATAARAVEGQAMPAAQARRLLARQLRQVPRWLGQTRYNGPPPLKAPRASMSTAADYSNNAAVSADGRRVVWERYDASLATAKRRGEIGVMAAVPGGAAPVLVSFVPGPWPSPSSDYNPALSADGRFVAFESAEGNLNFAKRYGQMRVYLRDLRRGVTLPVSHRPGLRASRSAYNPTVSGDGRIVAFEAYERPDVAGGRVDVLVTDRAGRRTRRVPRPAGAGAPSEPRLSEDGRFLAFSAVGDDGHSRVYLRDLVERRTRLVSAAGEEAWEPVPARGARVVAYTATSPGGGSRVVVARPGGRRSAVPAFAPGGSAFEPSVSADGGRVAFVFRPGSDRRTQVVVHDARTGASELVSRGNGRAGAPSLGTAGHPAISGDGRRVVFTSDAWDLSPAKCNSARGIFLRDLDAHTTTLVSRGDGANRYSGPTRGSSTDGDAFVTLVCG